MSTISRPLYEIKLVETKDELEACYDIRIEVFSVEQGFPIETEIDEYDPTSTHLLLTTPVASPPDVSTSSITPSIDPTSSQTSQKPIGTIRWIPEKGKVSRLVVAKDYRKYGFGRILVDRLHKHIAETPRDKRAEIQTLKEEGGKQVAEVALHSQIHAIPFYEKMGYKKVGDEFEEEGAPHFKMVCDITLS